MNEADNISVKVVILGEPAVGKTSLRLNYIGKGMKRSGEFLMTLGADLSESTIKISDKITLDAQIWDIGGQESFLPIIGDYLKGTQGAILVYDMTRGYTFDKISNWLEKLHEENPELENNIPFILVGNKADLDNFYDYDEEKVLEFVDYINRHNLYSQTEVEHINTSAKTGLHVKQAFKRLGKKIIRNFVKQGEEIEGAKELFDDLQKQEKEPDTAPPVHEPEEDEHLVRPSELLKRRNKEFQDKEDQRKQDKQVRQSAEKSLKDKQSVEEDDQHDQVTPSSSTPPSTSSKMQSNTTKTSEPEMDDKPTTTSQTTVECNEEMKTRTEDIKDMRPPVSKTEVDKKLNESRMHEITDKEEVQVTEDSPDQMEEDLVQEQTEFDTNSEEVSDLDNKMSEIEDQQPTASLDDLSELTYGDKQNESIETKEDKNETDIIQDNIQQDTNSKLQTANDRDKVSVDNLDKEEMNTDLNTGGREINDQQVKISEKADDDIEIRSSSDTKQYNSDDQDLPQSPFKTEQDKTSDLSSEDTEELQEEVFPSPQNDNHIQEVSDNTKSSTEIESKPKNDTEFPDKATSVDYEVPEENSSSMDNSTFLDKEEQDEDKNDKLPKGSGEDVISDQPSTHENTKQSDNPE